MELRTVMGEALMTTETDQSFILGSHFTSTNHQVLNNVKIHVLDFILLPPKGEKSRKLHDSIVVDWIHHLSTGLPCGLNTLH